MTFSAQKLYLESPVFFQTALLNLYALKLHHRGFGKKLDRYLRWFEETEQWSLTDLGSYQEERLRIVIKHAYDTVPFYQDRMQAAKLTPSDIRSLGDLPKMPLLTKEDVKKNLDALISLKFKKGDLIHGHTSGTTGSPLDVYYDPGMVLINNAADWRQKAWAGLNVGDRYAVILGRVTVPIPQKRPPFWRMNFIHNQLWFSAFHMSERNLEYYVEKLKEFRPKAIEGYPSTIYILARSLNQRGLNLPMKAVLTSSETLFPHQREMIEKAFQCKIFDFYGLAERVIFATECSIHNGKHLHSEYGITEVIDEKGCSVPKGTTGRMVGTSLHNLGMPLIRYVTSDHSSFKEAACSCGRKLPLMDAVTTKQEDIVLTPDGRWISPSILTHPFKPIRNILESQIIQEEPGLFVIKIIKGPLYSELDSIQLLEGLKERLGNAVEIHLEFVDEIPREPSGKFRWVISKIHPKKPTDPIG